jgi:hypothetical protein
MGRTHVYCRVYCSGGTRDAVYMREAARLPWALP